MLANTPQEYFELTSRPDATVPRSAEEMVEWVQKSPLFSKVDAAQKQRFLDSIHYSERGGGIGDFYYADLANALSFSEFESFLSALGMSLNLFGIIRDYYCYDDVRCKPMKGYACAYLSGIGCRG